ncbi:MAG: HPr family phosphocarrier protein [Verrucomicrobia bacterium]|nr:HPr family phosphocarrier protein [Verrucomicrobiota bacterium]MBU4289645.1 HPr family phosphocarrier protein [Verrucomicrobiota bacterium]MBU4430101.1 HPr family phosphocarrier protein [Verrucomicrobiota bacterium]MCG2681343.1 HPr family phosphocarrier protein [Kiritimatiellia bacterium]
MSLNSDNSPSNSRANLMRELVIQNQYGIHARPAAMFVKMASKFQSDVTVEKGNMKVSGKSIMGLMTLEVGNGAKVKIHAEGVDAEQVLDELQKLVEQKFHEE